MTLEPYNGRLGAFYCEAHCARLYGSASFLSARARRSGGCVECTTVCEVRGVLDEKGHWKYKASWPAIPGRTK